jgi:hypothetical protein
MPHLREGYLCGDRDKYVREIAEKRAWNADGTVSTPITTID